MSWKNAKEEARLWLSRSGLPEDLTGQQIDPVKLAEELPFEGTFRDMVLRALVRMLKRRGATITGSSR